jgi:hypothetical protein
MEKTERIIFRASPAERDLVISLARVLNRSQGGVIRLAIWELAKSKLDNQGESEVQHAERS